MYTRWEISRTFSQTTKQLHTFVFKTFFLSSSLFLFFFCSQGFGQSLVLQHFFRWNFVQYQKSVVGQFCLPHLSWCFLADLQSCTLPAIFFFFFFFNSFIFPICHYELLPETVIFSLFLCMLYLVLCCTAGCWRGVLLFIGDVSLQCFFFNYLFIISHWSSCSYLYITKILIFVCHHKQAKMAHHSEIFIRPIHQKYSWRIN